MQTQVYRIDETQLNKIRNRAIVRLLKISIPTILFVFISQYFQVPKAERHIILLSAIFIVPVMFIPIYAGTNKIKKAYGTLEIVLSDKGVESKADGFPYKMIIWEKLLITEKPNGMILLEDNSLSSFTRWLNGAGRIMIQPEMIDRDTLLSELYKHYRSLG